VRVTRKRAREAIEIAYILCLGKMGMMLKPTKSRATKHIQG
jgi:hypothetical protein